MTNRSIIPDVDRERDANLYDKSVDDIPIDLGCGSIQVSEQTKPKRHIILLTLPVILVIIIILLSHLIFD